MRRITDDQLRIAKRERAKGETWEGIARQLGVSSRTIKRHAKAQSWFETVLPGSKPDKAGQSLTKVDSKTIEQIAELVRDSLANDVEASANALANWQADDLDLRDWEKRERIAESIQKRASSLLNIGNQPENVVNIAVLSQLPVAASSSVIAV